MKDKTKMKATTKMNHGAYRLAEANGSGASRIRRRMKTKRPNAMAPPTRGEKIQLAAIRPILAHRMAPKPPPTKPKPTTAPTMEWVVETGIPRAVATWSQMAAASRAEVMPQRMRLGLGAKTAGSTMPFRTVSVTWEPTRTAPASSKTAAMITACFRVKAPDPTEVPMALARSLAPMFQAM